MPSQQRPAVVGKAWSDLLGAGRWKLKAWERTWIGFMLTQYKIAHMVQDFYAFGWRVKWRTRMIGLRNGERVVKLLMEEK
jgi:hypothetical protein